MKIVFLGTPEIAAANLHSLYLAPNIEILAVVTQPDKPVGRKKTLTPPPVKRFAEKIGIKLHQPRNKKELDEVLHQYSADFFVVIAYGMILSDRILEMPKAAAINIHMSLLPKYRGASPIQEALLNGDQETGISIIKITHELDAGPVYFLKRIAIEESDNLTSLTDRLSRESSKILPHALTDIQNGVLIALEQNIKQQKISNCRKISKMDGMINWKKQSAEEIINMMRAYTPWPGVWTELNNKKVKILKAKASEEKIKVGEFNVDGKDLKIGTKNGSLLPSKLQVEGKQPTDAGSFINGYLNQKR